MRRTSSHWRPSVIRLLRAVLLDLGDTLVLLDRPWEEVFNAGLEAIYAFLAKHELQADFERFSKTFVKAFEEASATSDIYKIEIPMEEIISKALRKLKFKPSDEPLVHSAMLEWYRPEIEAWQLYPDTIQSLDALRSTGFQMGLISNSRSEWAVNTILEKFDLQKFFRVIVTSAELRIRKPRAGIFMRALNALNVRPSESVFVGDSLEADIIGARSLGMRAIHLRRKTEERAITADPDATVDSLSMAVDQISVWKNASVVTVSASR